MNTLQHTATHRNTPKRTATHCNTLQHTVTYCDTRRTGKTVLQREQLMNLTLEHVATQCNTLHRTTTHRNAPHRTATHCNTLQHATTHYNTQRTANEVLRREQLKKSTLVTAVRMIEMFWWKVLKTRGGHVCSRHAADTCVRKPTPGCVCMRVRDACIHTCSFSLSHTHM